MKTIALAVLLSTVASATAINNNLQVTGSGGLVSVYYVSESAMYVDDTYFVTEDSSQFLFANHPAPAFGTRFDLGYFPLGTQLFFGVFVHDTDLSFLSGDASNNIDNYAHFKITEYHASGGIPSGRLVNVEDQLDGGDKDHDDSRYVVAITAGAPEPGTSAMLGFGLVLVFASEFRRRRRS